MIDRLQQRIPPGTAEYLHNLLTAVLAALAIVALLMRGLTRGPAAAVAAAV